MVLTGVKPGDIVHVDVKGRRAFGIVKEKERGKLRIKPITSNFTWTEIKANQVIGHYSQRKGSVGVAWTT